jgi:hypothetical protein
VSAIAAMDQAAQELANAYQKFDDAHAVAIRGAAGRGDGPRQETSDGLSLNALCVSLAQRMTGLGLGALVADAAVARAAAVPMGSGGEFVARWSARVRHLVP